MQNSKNFIRCKILFGGIIEILLCVLALVIHWPLMTLDINFGHLIFTGQICPREEKVPCVSSYANQFAFTYEIEA